MIRFTCACGKVYQLKDELAGKKVKCPACQAVLTIPEAAAKPSQLLPIAAGTLPPPSALAPLGNDDLFAALPAAPALTPASSAIPATVAAANNRASPLASGHARPTSRSAPIAPLVWVIAGVSGVAVLAVLGIVAAVVMSVAGNRMAATQSVPNAAASGASTSNTNAAPGMNKPVITRDARGQESIGSDVGQWQTYTSESGGYTIKLPGKPQIVPQSIPVPGGKVEGVVVLVGSDSIGKVALVSHFDMPFDASSLPLDKLMELQVAQQKGRISRSHDITMSGREGKEFIVDIPNMGGVPGKGLFRSLVVNGRIYSMGFLARSDRFEPVEAIGCVDSFTITKEPPSTAATAPQLPKMELTIAQTVQWTPYNCIEHGAKVEFPAPPAKGQSPDQAGRDLMHMAQCVIAGKGSFGILAQFPPVPLPEAAVALTLDVTKKGLIEKKGRLISERSGKQGGFEVVDLTLEEVTGGRGLIRIYFARDRTFVVTWSGPPDQETSPEVDRFFRSFEITTASPPPSLPRLQ